MQVGMSKWRVRIVESSLAVNFMLVLTEGVAIALHPFGTLVLRRQFDDTSLRQLERATLGLGDGGSSLGKAWHGRATGSCVPGVYYCL